MDSFWIVIELGPLASGAGCTEIVVPGWAAVGAIAAAAAPRVIAEGLRRRKGS
jgi:hypothetical protein